MIKKLILSLCLIPLVGFSTVIEDHYTLNINLKVPRVFNNTASLGYRKYQSQIIKGKFIINWDDSSGEWTRTFIITNLYNKTHKINDSYVRYSVEVDNEGNVIYPRLNYIGNNKNKEFKVPNICFYFVAVPSYNIGDPEEPDNTLLVTLSGHGVSKLIKDYNLSRNKIRIISSISGKVTGTLGCGCSSYGHVSPTRNAAPYGPDLDSVQDVSSVDGTWKIKFSKRVYKSK